MQATTSAAPNRAAQRSLIYIHGLAPPTPGGVSVIVHMLLSRTGFRIDVFTDLRLRRRMRHGGLVLPAKYHWLPRLPRWGDRPVRAIAAAQIAFNAGIAVLGGAWAALVARRRRADWIVSVVDEGFAVTAGYVCSRLSGRPLVLWIFDPWEENAYSRIERWIARRLEARIWRHASAIVVHSAQLRDHYRAKHGVVCELVPTPVDLDRVSVPGSGGASRGDVKEVLVAGAIYWLQEDAVRRLGRVCRRLPDVSLTLLSGPELLRVSGIDADRVEPPIRPDDLRARLERADVLFLGLSFDAPAPLVARTSAPARLPEYMASGTPILIHAPEGSHVADYAEREGFATVVDEPDDARLEAALSELLADPKAQARASRAAELARERHSALHVAEELERILEDVRTP